MVESLSDSTHMSVGSAVVLGLLGTTSLDGRTVNAESLSMVGQPAATAAFRRGCYGRSAKGHDKV